MSKNPNKKKKKSKVAAETVESISLIKAAKTDESKTESQLLGTSKAVETMFRNSLRAELDLITLAATKANIMISLNGIIISALMISGAFIFVSSAAFLVPAGMFMFTAAASIFFAILAASPEKANYFSGFSNWFKAFTKREARIRDLRRYLTSANQTCADGNEINLLINKDRMQLSQQEYWERMQILMRDREKTYHAMSGQLYWLGQIAARNLRLLNISYSLFRWGMLASVIVSMVLKGMLLFNPVMSEIHSHLDENGLGTLPSVFEPSAVQQLADGRLLVVEDEAQRAMNILNLGAEGSLSKNAATSLQLTRGFGRKLNDLEGLSADDQGFIYAITSHSLTTSGKRDPDREQLLRFRIDANVASDIHNVTTLRDELSKSKILATAFKTQTNSDINLEALNIEGLAFNNKDQSLMLGIREPMAGELSIIVPIENPNEMFTNNQPAMIGQPIFLDLEGGGIRSLYFDALSNDFVIANEVEDQNGKKKSKIWRWSGKIEDKPVEISLPAVSALKNIEAIDSINVDGKTKMVFMADEGDALKGIHARYVMIDYEKLRSK